MRQRCMYPATTVKISAMVIALQHITLSFIFSVLLVRTFIFLHSRDIYKFYWTSRYMQPLPWEVPWGADLGCIRRHNSHSTVTAS